MAEYVVIAPGIDRLRELMAAAPEMVTAAQSTALTMSALAVEAEVKRRTPRKTGRLQAAWSPEVISAGIDATARVHNPVSYGPYVEEGTGPHVITPRDKMALSWPGAAHPVKSVNHPGTRGRHMARDASVAATPAVGRIFEEAIKGVLAELARL